MERRNTHLGAIIVGVVIVVLVTLVVMAAPDANDDSRPHVLGEAIERTTSSLDPSSTSAPTPATKSTGSTGSTGSTTTTTTTVVPVSTTAVTPPPATTTTIAYELVTAHADNTYDVVVGADGEQLNATSSKQDQPGDKLIVDVAGGVDNWTFSVRLSLQSKASKAFKFPDGFKATVQVVRGGEVVRTLTFSAPSIKQLAPGGQIVRTGVVELPHQAGTYRLKASIPVLKPT